MSVEMNRNFPIYNFTKWRHSQKVLRSVAQAFDLGIASQVKNMWVRLTGKKEKSVSYAREDFKVLCEYQHLIH